MANYKRGMSHQFKSYRHNFGKYSKIRKLSVDFDGDPSFLHRCHRTKAKKCGIINKRRDLISDVCDEELAEELGPSIRKHLKL